MKLQVTQPSPILPELVPVGESTLPRWWRARLWDDSDSGEPDVTFRFEVRDGVPECREVHIIATDDGHEVRYSGLAGLRVEDVMEQSSTWLRMFLGEEVPVEFPLPGVSTEGTQNPIGSMRGARAARKVKVTDELLRKVAEVYRANLDGQPTAAVADHFDRSHRTAGLYVRRARDRGLLGDAIRGKAGER